MNKEEELKKLSKSLRQIMRHARSKDCSVREVEAISNRVNSLWYAKEDLD